MKEEWKIINDFPDYQISNYGRVKSLKFRKEKILNFIKSGSGYLQIRLYKGGKSKLLNIHILEYEVFNSKLGVDECIHHKDGNKKNNILNNLRKMNKYEHNVFHNLGQNNPNFGKKRPGNKSGRHKLFEYQVHQIHKLYKLGFDIKKISLIYRISQRQINDIISGKYWKNVYEKIGVNNGI